MIQRTINLLVEKLGIKLIFAIKERPFLLLLILGANLGGFSIASIGEIINAEELEIKPKFVEVLILAAPVIGAGINGSFSDRAGRKSMILSSNLLIFCGMGIFLCKSRGAVIVARALTGVGIGLSSAASILYASESAPDEIRGSVITAYGLLYACGQSLATIAISVIKKVNMDWRWALMVPGLSVIGQIFLLSKLPESPRWLGQQERYEEVIQVFRLTEPDEETAREACQRIRDSVEVAKLDELLTGKSFWGKIKYSWRDLRKSLVSGILLQVLQQFVGFNLVNYLMPKTLQDAGVESRFWSLTIPLGFGVVASILTFLVIDYFGRVVILAVSLVLTFIDLVGLSIIFQDAGKAPKKHGTFKTVLLGTYLVAYKPGIGTIPVILSTELYPMHYRSFCNSLCSMTVWLSNLLVTSTATYLRDKVGPKFIFAGNAVIAAALGGIATTMLLSEPRQFALEHVFQHVSYERWPVERQLEPM